MFKNFLRSDDKVLCDLAKRLIDDLRTLSCHLLVKISKTDPRESLNLLLLQGTVH